ncbi:alpha/beta fold hydrolase [Nocardioides bruguierae]|uniref:prolyl aminopeptidase n=1 Tax=Nocardioides bruguierae TaxID=2945102 RepID=A0A9X2DAT3_9ACTN|nr:alpha/beta fold hydrolase [Nocardioides bruguierae]MCM0622528.1 alpha/beta fold hydrolase [Nocardioides bruguierae]
MGSCIHARCVLTRSYGSGGREAARAEILRSCPRVGRQQPRHPGSVRLVENDIPVLASGLLRVDGPHSIYWEESGNHSGIPCLFLHGGPGGTLARGGYRRRFDLRKARVVGIDQRGCGRSIPNVMTAGYNLAENTTTELIRDIEAVREHLGIDRWLINGVSWGSTLAMAYAIKHPERVSGIVLFAVTVTDRCQVDWITDRVQMVYPEAWNRLVSFAERELRGFDRRDARVVDAYAELMRSDDMDLLARASMEWCIWEDQHISVGTGDLSLDPKWLDSAFRMAFARLVTHYWSHDAFLPESILDQTASISHIPLTMIHGRRDVSGPARFPWELHQRHENSELIMVEDEGHGGAKMVKEWTAANDRHLSRIASIASGPN